MKIRMLALFAAVAVGITAFAAEPLRIAFQGAGYDDLMRPNVQIRVDLSMFLNDMLGREPAFRLVSEDRTTAIYRLIKCGACDYGTDNIYEIYNRYYPADVVCDYYATGFNAEGKWSGEWVLVVASKDSYEKKSFTRKSTYELSLEITEMLIKACKLDEKTAKRLRAFAKEKSKVFHAIYNVPRCTGHYCDNTGETQMKSIMGSLSYSKGDIRVNARVVNAAYAGMCDSRAIGLGSHDPKWTVNRVLAMGMNAFQIILGTTEEDWMRGFVSHPRSGTLPEPVMLECAKSLTEDAISRSMETAMESAESDELDLDASEDKTAAKEAKADARARGSIKGLGWARSDKGLPILLKCAAQKEAVTRRTIAKALGFYCVRAEDEDKANSKDERVRNWLAKLKKNRATAVEALLKLANDEDTITAVLANWSLVNLGEAAKAKPTAARKVIDKKKFDAGVYNYDVCESALAVLAAIGDDSDSKRFHDYTNDAKVERRINAVRGIFARTKFTDEDLKLMDDTDHRVTVAALNEIKGDQVKGELRKRVITLANDPCNAVAEAARSPLQAIRPSGGAELVEFQMLLENPLIRRLIIDDCVAKKDVKSVIGACSNPDAHIRAYALKALVKLDPKAARTEALRLLTDAHTYSRFYATYVLAETAEKGDLAALETAAKKEFDRAARLYLADAIARAKGEPKPAPQKAVNSAFESGRAISWQCGRNEPHSDTDLYSGYYTCSEPFVPTPEMIKAHEERKACIFPRPTPCGDPARILVDAAVADIFWTELNRQLPNGVYEYVDGFVYGEESMGLSGWSIWPEMWRTFCAKTGIDPKRVNGDRKKLTENERLAFGNWSARFAVRGFNELYDFTKDYWGKLRPGIAVCTYDCKYGFGDADVWKDFKFDLGGTYIYDGDHRWMYHVCRMFKSLWPDRPLQWLSFGHINIGLGSSAYGKPVTWNTTMPTRPMARRFEHCYADSFAVWLAGADTGYFTNYSTAGAEVAGGNAGPGGGPGNIGAIYHGSKVLKASAKNAVGGAYLMMKDAANKKKRATIDPADMMEDEDSDEEEVELEEEGGKNDPIQKQVDAQELAVYRGFLYMNRMTRDTTSVEIGLPRQLPGHHDAFLISGGPSCDGNTGMLLPRWDHYQNAYQPIAMAGLKHYKLACVGGATQRMSEATRCEWIKWLKENPVVLVIEGGLFATGIKYPYIDIDHLNGDLKTYWPWEKEIYMTKFVPATPKDKAKPVRLGLGEEGKDAKPDTITVLESDEFGATRVMWQGKGFKGIVVFDYTKRSHENTISMRKFLREWYAKNNVKMELNEHPGTLKGGADGLNVELLSWHSWTTNATLKGMELLTGQHNPKLTPRYNCAVTTEEYVGPCIVVHGGVEVFSHDCKLEVLEKLPNGVKVKVKGLVHAATKSGALAKISGKELKEIDAKDVDVWFIEGQDKEGIGTMTPHGQVECIKWDPVPDEMPSWRVFRVKDWTELTITM